MALTLPDTTRTPMAAALLTLFNAGSTIKIYTGSRPLVSVAATGTLLATIALKSPAFTNSNGVLTIAVPDAVTAVASGEATYFRATNATAVTILDGSVGTSGADLNLATTSITTGLSISIVSGNITMPAG